MTFTDNERVIAWMTHHQFAFVWDATGPTWLSPEMTHRAGIWSIALPAGEKTLLSSGLDGQLFVWDLGSGEQGHTIALTPARLPGQPLVTPVVGLSTDGKRAVWIQFPAPEVFDLPSGLSEFVVPLPSAAPAPVQFNASQDLAKLVAVSRQSGKKRCGACAVWDLATRRRLAEFDVEPSGLKTAPTPVLSPDGTRLALITGRKGEDGAALVFVGYDVKTGKKLAEVEEPIQFPASVSLAAADNEWLVVTSTKGRVWTVNYAKGRVGKDLDKLPVRGEAPVYGPVVFSPDGKRFATGVVGKRFTTYGVRVYDWPRGKLLQTFLGHRGPVTALRFAPDGNSLATGAQDASVLLWDLTKPGDRK